MSSSRRASARRPSTLRLGLACALALSTPLAAAPRPSAPPEIVDEAKRLLAGLVAIDTTHGGSTQPAAELVAAHLRAAGFAPGELEIVGPRPEKANLLVRYPGRGAGKPILFLCHLDVVDAERADWTVEPFVLTEQDGWLYGRGTLDIKGECADLAVNFARLRQAGWVPERELRLALTADEEGGEENGVVWLLANRRDWLDVDYVINTDAGGLQEQQGKLVRMPLQTSEKLYLTFELETTHPGGHSSLPTRDNAIYRLAAALARLDGFEFPVTLNDTTRLFFERLAAIEQGDLAPAFRGILESPPAPAAVTRLSAIPLYNGTMRTVCTPTLLSAGHAENALPQRAKASLQCRLLPGDDPAAVLGTIVERIADPGVTVTPLGNNTAAPASPVRADLFAIVERITGSLWPGVPVVPVMDPWSTDGAHLRRAGVPVYGVSGVYFDVDDVRAHGQDERIAVAAFAGGLEFMHRLMRALGEATPAGH